MKFVILNDGGKMSILANFFEKPDYEGDGQDMPLGRYNREQFHIKTIGSVKLKENVTLAVYENPDRSGRVLLLSEDVPDLSKSLPFTPSVFTLAHSVGAYEGEVKKDNLVPGVYNAASLRGFGRLRIPEETRVTFWSGEGNDPGESGRSFEKGDLVLDEGMRAYDKFAIIPILSGEAARQAGESGELSDEELLSVAGGECKAMACAAAACAADMCSVDACAAKACAVNAFPFLPISP
ncbi:MAG: hypothetical protein LBQ58_04250 [Synergistaceae bacterium]|nr:hypothetical protein [Synergistaceae bacterium]